MNRRSGSRRSRVHTSPVGLNGVPKSVATLAAWWRADYGVTTATGVSQWRDGTTGRLLTQATPGKQPTRVTPSELGSKPALRFDGTDDVLVSTEAATAWNLMSDGTGVTAFVACVQRSGGSNLTLLSTETSTTSQALWWRIDAAANSNYLFVYNTSASPVGTALITATPGHASVAFDTRLITDYSYSESASPEWTLRNADTTRASGASAAAPSGPAPSTLAVCGFSNGGGFGAFDIAEIIIYSSALSSGDKTAIYNYLLARYS